MTLSSAHRSRSKNMATALNQRQGNPFDNDNAAPSSNIGLGIGGAGYRAGGNKNEAFASHYRRSDAGHVGPPSEALTSLSAHRGQNPPRPPAQQPKQRNIYQDLSDDTADKSQSSTQLDRADSFFDQLHREADHRAASTAAGTGTVTTNANAAPHELAPAATVSSLDSKPL